MAKPSIAAMILDVRYATIDERIGRVVNGLQRIGGIAALIEAAAFVVGFGLFATVLSELGGGNLGPVRTVAFLADNTATLYLWNLVIYVVFGLALVVCRREEEINAYYSGENGGNQTGAKPSEERAGHNGPEKQQEGRKFLLAQRVEQHLDEGHDAHETDRHPV